MGQSLKHAIALIKSTVVVKSCQKVYISQLRKPATDKSNRYADT